MWILSPVVLLMANVLVVEDQDAIRELLITYLKLDGHNATGASDAEQGLAMFRAGDFGVVVSDLMMPGKDGIWLLGQLQAESRDFKFILSTGYDGADVAVNALRHGAFDYVVKPVDSLTFKTKVRDAAAALEAETRSRDAERAAQRRTEDASVLYSIGSIMARNLDLPSALASAVDHLSEILRRPAFCWLQNQAGLPELVRSAGGRAPSRESIESWWRGNHSLEVTSGWLLAAVSHAGSHLGCIGIGADGVDAELADLLPSLGEVIGVTVWNAASFARERRRSEQLRAINEFGRDVLEARDFDVVIARALEGAGRVMSVDRGALVGFGGPTPRVHASLHAAPADLELSAPRWGPVIDALLAGREAAARTTYIPDLDVSEYDVGDLVSWARSVVVLPLRTDDEERLALVLGNSDRPDAFDADDLAAAETFADLIAVALAASNRLESVERRGFEEQWALLEMSDRLGKAQNEAAVADIVVEVARRALGAAGVTVHALANGCGAVVASTFGDAGALTRAAHDSSVSIARQGRRPVVCAALREERRFEPSPLALESGMTSALIVSAESGGAEAATEAAIEVYWRSPRTLAAREIRLASLLTQQAAVGFELVRLRSAGRAALAAPACTLEHGDEKGGLQQLLMSLDAGLQALETAAGPGEMEKRTLEAALALSRGSAAWLSFFDTRDKSRWHREPECAGKAAPPPGVMARLRRSARASQFRTRNGQNALAVVPITRGSAVRGVLVVEVGGREFTATEIQALALLAQQGALVRELAERNNRATAVPEAYGEGPALERVA